MRAHSLPGAATGVGVLDRGEVVLYLPTVNNLCLNGW
jgi:hypothetical protein